MFSCARSRYATFDRFHNNLREQIDQVLQVVKTRFGTINEYHLRQTTTILSTPVFDPFTALVTLGCIFVGITLGTVQGDNPPRTTTLSHLESAAMVTVLHPG